MLRPILAVLAGCAAAVFVVWAVEGLSATVYPKPVGLDWHDMDQVRVFVASLSNGAKAFVVAAWLLGAFAGGLVTTLVAKHRTGLALLPGLLIVAACVANAMLLPHPKWMPVVGIALALPMAWLGGRLAARLVTPKGREGGAWKGGTR